jgi:hypothetical protein
MLQGALVPKVWTGIGRRFCPSFLPYLVAGVLEFCPAKRSPCSAIPSAQEAQTLSQVRNSHIGTKAAVLSAWYSGKRIDYV